MQSETKPIMAFKLLQITQNWRMNALQTLKTEVFQKVAVHSYDVNLFLMWLILWARIMHDEYLF